MRRRATFYDPFGEGDGQGGPVTQWHGDGCGNGLIASGMRYASDACDAHVDNQVQPAFTKFRYEEPR